jgi:hypothetical protein
MKVRLQTRALGAPSTMLGTIVHVFKNDGFLGLYSGVCAHNNRQALSLRILTQPLLSSRRPSSAK